MIVLSLCGQNFPVLPYKNGSGGLDIDLARLVDILIVCIEEKLGNIGVAVYPSVADAVFRPGTFQMSRAYAYHLTNCFFHIRTHFFYLL